MATTPTTKLALNKQDAGDDDWDVDLNAGFDNADSRFIKVSDDYSDDADPNDTPVAGDYIGQQYVDVESDPPRLWHHQGANAWELLNTKGVKAEAVIGGNIILEDILQDFQSRLDSLEAVQLPLRGLICGLETSRVAATTVGVAIGSCANTSAVGPPTILMRYNSAWTKTLVTPWVQGTGNAGISAGCALTVDTIYHVFAFLNTTGPVLDIGLDTDVDAANLIANEGADYYRRLGSITTTAASEIDPFIQVGDYFHWVTPAPSDLNRALSLWVPTPPDYGFADWYLRVPPVRTEAYLWLSQKASAGSRRLYMRTCISGFAGESADPAAGWCVNGEEHDHMIVVPTDSDVKVQFAASSGGATLTTVISGYMDFRGKDL